MMRPAGDLPSHPVIVKLTAVEDEPGIFVRSVSGSRRREKLRAPRVLTLNVQNGEGDVRRTSLLIRVVRL